MPFSHKATTHGFSLVELLVVVSIIGILATIVTVSVNRSYASARDTQRISNLNTIQLGLELFRAQNGCYPSDIGARDSSIGWGTNSELGSTWHPSAGLSELVNDGILPELPEDPLNTSSYYINYEPHCTLPSEPSFSGCKQGYSLRVRLESNGQWHSIDAGVQSDDSDCTSECGYANSSGACL